MRPCRRCRCHRCCVENAGGRARWPQLLLQQQWSAAQWQTMAQGLWLTAACARLYPRRRASSGGYWVIPNTADADGEQFVYFGCTLDGTNDPTMRGLPCQQAIRHMTQMSFRCSAAVRSPSRAPYAGNATVVSLAQSVLRYFHKYQRSPPGLTRNALAQPAAWGHSGVSGGPSKMSHALKAPVPRFQTRVTALHTTRSCVSIAHARKLA